MAKKHVLAIPTVEDLMEGGAHFGHLSRRWHPKNEPYILKKVRGLHILDPRKTQENLKKATDFLNKVSRGGGVVLFVGLKRQSQDLVEEYAQGIDAPYMAGRWVGGLLTNFSEVIKNVSKLKELEKGLAEGEFDYYTKKERLDIKRKIEKLDRDFGGVRNLENIPDALVVSSVRKGGTAVNEAETLGIPVVGFVDSDTEPRVDYPIPANDESIKALSVLFPPLFEAVRAGEEEQDIKVKVEKIKDSKDKGKEEKEEKKEEKEVEAGSLEALGLGSRAVNALEKAGIGIDKVRTMSKDALTDIKGIGEKTAENIVKAFEGKEEETGNS